MITVSGQNKQNQISLDSSKITRSTFGISGISKTFKTENGIYIISQSVGQASVIGTFKASGYTIRQGFQQPLLKARAIPLLIDNSFSAKLFPNPFTESIYLSFDIIIKDELLVYVYDVKGNLVFYKEYPATPLLSVDLSFLRGGYYILKIITNKKQFISNLIKH